MDQFQGFLALQLRPAGLTEGKLQPCGPSLLVELTQSIGDAASSLTGNPQVFILGLVGGLKSKFWPGFSANLTISNDMLNTEFSRLIAEFQHNSACL